MKEKITTIIFDWAGVFCSPGEPFSHPSLPAKTGLSIDEMGAKTQHIQTPYYKGEMSTNKFWKNIINFLGIKNISQKELSKSYLSSYTIYPEMLDLAKNLKNTYKTALLSNLTEEMTNHILTAHKVKEFFGSTFFSNRIGLMKPNKEAYEYAIEQLDSKPEETLFIDDSIKNVEAAKKLGMKAFVFKSPTQCKQELLRFTSRTNHGSL